MGVTIKTKEIPFSEFKNHEMYKNELPKRQSSFWCFVARLLSAKEVKNSNLQVKYINAKKNDKEPALILMNHSSFFDFRAAYEILKDRKFNVVASDDILVGMEYLLKSLGAIPTKKFITDIALVKNIKYALDKLNQSVLMYPEAQYTFDGRLGYLPKQLGKSVKFFNHKVLLLKSNLGDYLMDPIYNNNGPHRKVDSKFTLKTILTKEQVFSLSHEEIQKIIESEMDYDHFKEQLETKTIISENFRANNLNKILYKCPYCNKEDMTSNNTKLICKSCGHESELGVYGEILNNKFKSVSEWVDYERIEAKKENQTFSLNEDVTIYGMKDFDKLYFIGDGTINLNKDKYSIYYNNEEIININPKTQYTINVDYDWYYLGDIISLANNKVRYICVLKNKNKNIVTKVRLIHESLYCDKYNK